jgi:hypothetical protein
VALTYNQPHHGLDSFALAVTSTLAGIAGEMNELFVTLFLFAEIEELLRRQRFDDIVHLGSQEAVPSTSLDGPMSRSPERNGCW